MNQDDIIRMAREAKADYDDGVWLLMPDELQRFAALVAANEREACAKLCDAELAEFGEFDADVRDVAAAIRARGNVREHTMSGDCWCNPELNYTDPETGAEVWVHKEPQ